MEDIEKQTVPAYEGETCETGHVHTLGGSAGFEVGTEGSSCKKEEKIRNKGEVVAAEKGGGGEAQGEQIVGFVQKSGEIQLENAVKADVAAWNVYCQSVKQGKQDYADNIGQALGKLPYEAVNHSRNSKEMKHSENNYLRGHNQRRHKGHRHSYKKVKCATLEVVLRVIRGNSRNSYKRARNKGLKPFHYKVDCVGKINPVNKSNIVINVIYYHGNKGDSPYFVHNSNSFSHAVLPFFLGITA